MDKKPLRVGVASIKQLYRKYALKSNEGESKGWFGLADIAVYAIIKFL